MKLRSSGAAVTPGHAGRDRIGTVTKVFLVQHCIKVIFTEAATEKVVAWVLPMATPLHHGARATGEAWKHVLDRHWDWPMAEAVKEALTPQRRYLTFTADLASANSRAIEGQAAEQDTEPLRGFAATPAHAEYIRALTLTPAASSLRLLWCNPQEHCRNCAQRCDKCCCKESIF